MEKQKKTIIVKFNIKKTEIFPLHSNMMDNNDHLSKNLIHLCNSSLLSYLQRTSTSIKKLTIEHVALMFIEAFTILNNPFSLQKSLSENNTEEIYTFTTK